MWQAITSAISGLVAPITTMVTRKAEINEAQHTADLAAIKATGDRQAALISQGLAADANWEADSLKAGSGWMRGYELIVVSIPMVLCFTRFAPTVKAGFDALSGTPAWYQTVLVTIYLANYGVRLWRRNQSDT